MNALYCEMEWLPRATTAAWAEFTRAGEHDEHFGRALRSITSYYLDMNQLIRVARAIGRRRSAGLQIEPLLPYRLAVLTNATFDFIASALVATGARYGLSLEVVSSGHDLAVQQALTSASDIEDRQFDAVLVALDYRSLPISLCIGDATESAKLTVTAISQIKSLRSRARRTYGAPCIVQNFPQPVESLFGSLDRILPGTRRQLIDSINNEMAAALAESGDVLLDISALSEVVGLGTWHSGQLWNVARLPFSDQVIPLYADHVLRTINAIRGKSRRVLVMDLDDTLWGGTIADDGLHGIRLARGDPVGEGHLELQRMAVELRARGIILGIASKNEEALARAAFERHPEMMLKLKDIAAFQANFSDKPANLTAISKSLALGLDALVFLDNNPAERALVRRVLPDVAVPELPGDPTDFARTLGAAGYFEAVTYTTEDARRADSYTQRQITITELSQATNVDEYLSSLKMVLHCSPFDNIGRSRIIQLINKSNQYNLTTRRYTEAEIEKLETDPAVFTLQGRLSDRLGDNGMITVVICRLADAASWEIDTWLMSCRVLGRKVEHAVLNEILRQAHISGVECLVGFYRPTDRNKLAASHYSNLGFQAVSEDRDGTTRWELVVCRESRVHDCPVKIAHDRPLDPCSASSNSTSR